MEVCGHHIDYINIICYHELQLFRARMHVFQRDTMFFMIRDIMLNEHVIRYMA